MRHVGLVLAHLGELVRKHPDKAGIIFAGFIFATWLAGDYLYLLVAPVTLTMFASVLLGYSARGHDGAGSVQNWNGLDDLFRIICYGLGGFIGLFLEDLFAKDFLYQPYDVSFYGVVEVWFFVIFLTLIVSYLTARAVHGIKVFLKPISH